MNASVEAESKVEIPVRASTPGQGFSARPLAILCHYDDDVAASVGAMLMRRHGANSVRMVTMEELILAPSWAHRVGDSQAGEADCVRLHDGYELRSENLALVFNRLRYVYSPHFANAKAVDQEYAGAEIHALALSWLNALTCPVLNRPSPQGLWGRQLSKLAWNLSAAKAGFAVAPMRCTSSSRRYRHAAFPELTEPGADPAQIALSKVSDHGAWYAPSAAGEAISLLVVGEDVCGESPADVKAAGVRLAKMGGYSVLRIACSRDAGGGWRFEGVDTFPASLEETELAAVVALIERSIRTPTNASTRKVAN